MGRLVSILGAVAALMLAARVETFTQSTDEISPAAWAQADEATVRVSANDFPDVPPAIVAELNRRGCLIPQTYTTDQPHNIIKGRFTSGAATDRAVLCSRDRVSSLLVFRNGLTDSVIELEEDPDRNWLQGIGEGRIGFSRFIGVASPAYIVEHYERYGGQQPPPLDHDGIDHAFTEKGSTVLYWHEGRWLRLAGAD